MWTTTVVVWCATELKATNFVIIIITFIMSATAGATVLLWLSTQKHTAAACAVIIIIPIERVDGGWVAVVECAEKYRIQKRLNQLLLNV